MNESADHLLAESQQLVPLLTSDLLDTGRVDERATPADPDALIVYGTAYGAAQHEGRAIMNRGGTTYEWVVRSYSQPGRQAHFLSDPLKLHHQRYRRLVAAEVKAAVEGGA